MPIWQGVVCKGLKNFIKNLSQGSSGVFKNRVRGLHEVLIPLNSFPSMKPAHYLSSEVHQVLCCGKILLQTQGVDDEQLQF